MRSNSNDSGTQPYQGRLIITNQTLTFHGTTIQLRNVSKFSTHEMERLHLVKIPIMILAAFIFLVTFAFGLKWIAIAAAAIVGYGIYEYFIPKVYGLIIEMNSGSRHILRSKDKNGILEVRRKISEVMISDTPVTTTINFHSDKIEFAGDRISGDKYEVNNSTIDKMGSFDNNPKAS